MTETEFKRGRIFNLRPPDSKRVVSPDRFRQHAALGSPTFNVLCRAGFMEEARVNENGNKVYPGLDIERLKERVDHGPAIRGMGPLRMEKLRNFLDKLYPA
jgi:hypothetical protein